MRTHLALSAGFAGVCLAVLPAQNMALITQGDAAVGHHVHSMENFRRSLAATADGALWALVHETFGGQGRGLTLLRSADHGQTWNTVTETPEWSRFGRGSLAVGPDGQTLHLLYRRARTQTSGYQVYYQAYDTVADAWGPFDVIAASSAATLDYYPQDIEVTPAGTVVACYNDPNITSGSNRSASYLRIRQAGQTAFTPPLRINTTTTAIRPSLQAIGEVVHMVFRSWGGNFGVMYRAFDTESLAFTTPLDVPIDPGNMRATYHNAVAADPSGGLYVMYTDGQFAPGAGALRVAYAAPGSYATWTVQTVASDPILLEGVSFGGFWYRHYSLSTGDGDEVWAVYGKLTEGLHTLYARGLRDGQPLGPEQVLVATAENDTFAVVNGVRGTQSRTSPLVVIESHSAMPVGEQIWFVDVADGTLGRSTRFGVPCRGALAVAPLHDSLNLPDAGSTHRLGVRGAPPLLSGAVLLGATRAAVPLDLAAVGMPGCALNQDLLISIGFPTDASGAGVVPLGVPPGVWSGAPVLTQAFVLAPGANPFGGLTSNSAAHIYL